jgi:hypothetical protein
MFDALHLLQAVQVNSCFFSGSMPLMRSPFIHMQVLNFSFNLLEGSLTNFFDNSSHWRSLVSVSLNSNGFTGLLPSTLFRLPALQSVVLFSNCFSGSLPESICAASLLQVLVMDGLSSASVCDVTIPPFRAVFPRRFMQGGIPSCIWSMSTLATLHLSGNGLTGTLGELGLNKTSDKHELALASFSDISLASNNFVGTIPRSYQRYGRFVRLDLSSNRLSGTLVGDFVVNSSTQAIDLTVNRLSGKIPGALITAPEGVRILTGNLFQCEPDSMPVSDPDSSEYICGSNDFDISIAAWLVAFVLGVLVLVQLRCVFGFSLKPGVEGYDPEVSRGLSNSSDARGFGPLAWVSVIHEYVTGYAMLTPPASLRLLQHCHEFLSLLLRIMSTVAALSVAYLCVSMVTYIVLKSVGSAASIYSTHTEQYAWVTSAAYLHGWLPALLMMLYLFASIGYVSIALFGSGVRNGIREDISDDAPAKPTMAMQTGILL